MNRRIVTEGLPPVAKIGGSIAEGLAGEAVVGVSRSRGRYFYKNS